MNKSPRELPSLKKLTIPSYLTLTKGVKIKPGGINIKHDYSQVKIDQDNLSKYKTFLHLKSEIPLSYFYLMAQRAQAALMLKKEFTIAIPGLIHVSNKLEQINSIDYSIPFDLKTSVTAEFKNEGALVPKFTVEFWQKGIKVMTCLSTYLAKRKGGMKRTKTKTDFSSIANPNHSVNWEIPNNLGKAYGRASGDKNPLHSSDFFAKLIGFDSSILQGWYGVSRIVKECEEKNNEVYKSIEVDFRSPIFLPSLQKVEWIKESDTKLAFQITDSNSGKKVMQGALQK